MTEIRGRLLIDGTLVPGRVVVEGGTIAAVELNKDVAADAPVIAPGFIDLHVHGFGGCDPVEDAPGMALALAREGTTSFQPTLFPDEPARLGETCAALWASITGAGAAWRGAEAVGLHLEGPFVNPAAAGALPPECLAVPSVEALRSILGPATGDGRGVRTVTLAPELPACDELVVELVRCGVRVSLGHSIARGVEALAATRAGAVGVTHLFNAMTPFHHREPGLTGIALTEDTLFAEIIGDLVHVGERAVDLALAARGPEGLCLVSDALRGAGTGCDVFHDHGRDYSVHDGVAWIRDGEGQPERLAGSASSQLDMVRVLTAAGVVSLADALTMASASPARALGLEDRGVLKPGARADLVVLGSEGLGLEEVWLGGVRLESS